MSWTGVPMPPEMAWAMQAKYSASRNLAEEEEAASPAPRFGLAHSRFT